MKFYCTAYSIVVAVRLMCNVFFVDAAPFKKTIYIFEHMEIDENIYEGVVEPSYKKTTQIEDTCAGHSSKMSGGYSPSKINPEMENCSGKSKKRYV